MDDVRTVMNVRDVIAAAVEEHGFNSRWERQYDKSEVTMLDLEPSLLASARIGGDWSYEEGTIYYRLQPENRWFRAIVVLARVK